jgi:stage III sporulation protein AD
MDIFRISAVGIVAAVLAVVLKRDNPSAALMVSIAASLLIFVMIMPELATVIGLIRRLSAIVELGSGHITTVIKIIGIAYAAEFGAQICADAGESAVASKVELGGKVLIMAVSAPIIVSLIEQLFIITG